MRPTNRADPALHDLLRQSDGGDAQLRSSVLQVSGAGGVDLTGIVSSGLGLGRTRVGRPR
jgi:hypothetical protein